MMDATNKSGNKDQSVNAKNEADEPTVLYKKPSLDTFRHKIATNKSALIVESNNEMTVPHISSRAASLEIREPSTLLNPKQIIRRRRGKSIVLEGVSPNGNKVLSILFKRTYKIVPGEHCQLSDKDADIVVSDMYYGDQMLSSIQWESDYVPWKNKTDIVVNGKAIAPDKKPVLSLDVSIRVGDFTKRLRVIGQRLCQYAMGRTPVFTDPQPFAEMPIIYENAYGGVDMHSIPDTPFIYPRNHVGKGFAIKNTAQTIHNLKLPTIEDPASLLTPEALCLGDYMNWENQPIPAGFGWIAKMWQPRSSFAFTPQLDESGANSKINNDFRYFNGASPGLAVPYLKGGEKVQLNHLTDTPNLQFFLPKDNPRFGLDMGNGKTMAPDIVIHTVQFNMNLFTVDLVWRGAIQLSNQNAKQISKWQVVVE